MTKLTDAVFKNDVRVEANIQTDDGLKRFLETVRRNLDVFIALFELYNKITDNSFNTLVSVENDLTLFTYKQCNMSDYAENTVGECVVTNVRNSACGDCYINDLKG